jgi:hypothetical protein
MEIDDTECKVCTKCNVLRGFSEFNKEPRNKDGLRSWCKQCFLEYRRQHHCRQSARNSHLRRKYNMTHEQYVEMYDARDGECDICGEYHIKLCIDHSHATGRVRGLLCNECNKGLGMFRDNAHIIGSAIEYLLN